MLYYWYCHYGPGHHSHSDGYEEFDDSYTEDEIISEINERFYDYDWPITYVQKVNAIPKHILDAKIKDQENKIRYAQARIKELEKIASVEVPRTEEGVDDEIAEALKDKPLHNVILQLVKDGLYFTYEDIYDWKRCYDWVQRLRPHRDVRDAVLESIKKVKPYGKN